MDEDTERGWARRRVGTGAGVVLVGLLVAVSVGALAHEAHQTEGMDDQLVSAGSGLMVGSFDAPQEGPLVVVPYREGELGCGPGPEVGYVIPIGKGAAVSFVANATHVQAVVDLPPEQTGFVSFALDTERAHRTMMLMLEHAVAMHGMGAVLLEEGDAGVNATFDDGVMGVPYLFPDAPNASRSSKYFLNIDSPGGGIRMDFESSAPVTWCQGAEPGHHAIRFSRAGMGEALSEGAILHGLVHWDGELAEWLPRPIPSTEEFQVNLYLSRPGEDPEAIKQALDPGPDARTLASLAGLGLGLAAIVGVPRRGEA